MLLAFLISPDLEFVAALPPILCVWALESLHNTQGSPHRVIVYSSCDQSLQHRLEADSV